MEQIPLIPSPPRQVQEQIPWHVEWVKEERTEVIPREDTSWFVHDPIWVKRFWSIQHIGDCHRGTAFHWFWSPMGQVFELSQIVFMLWPIMMYFHHFSVEDIILWVLIFKIVIEGTKQTLAWYHNWSFMHALKRAKRTLQVEG